MRGRPGRCHRRRARRATVRRPRPPRARISESRPYRAGPARSPRAVRTAPTPVCPPTTSTASAPPRVSRSTACWERPARAADDDQGASLPPRPAAARLRRAATAGGAGAPGMCPASTRRVHGRPAERARRRGPVPSSVCPVRRAASSTVIRPGPNGDVVMGGPRLVRKGGSVWCGSGGAGAGSPAGSAAVKESSTATTSRPAASSREAAIAARMPLAQCTQTTPGGTSSRRWCRACSGMWTEPSTKPAARLGGASDVQHDDVVRPVARPVARPTALGQVGEGGAGEGGRAGSLDEARRPALRWRRRPGGRCRRAPVRAARRRVARRTRRAGSPVCPRGSTRPDRWPVDRRPRSCRCR